MADSVAHYVFFPWLRRGLAAQIEELEDLAAGTATAVHRAALAFGLELEYTRPDGALTTAAPAGKQVQLLGPPDVIGVKREAMIRSNPLPDTRDFPPNFLPYVEFFEEDLPWRYSPARAQDSKLRPWLAVLVLAPEEFERVETTGDRPQVIRLLVDIATVMPAPTELWAWAHVHFSKPLADAAEIQSTITQTPELALSRILAARRLEGERSYHAFVIPTYETGRLAGLGEDSAGEPAQRPAWGGAGNRLRADEFPIYHEFRFRTADAGDFESLVRKLVPGPVGPEFGRRKVDVRTPGFGLDGVGPETVELEGALRPPVFTPTPFPTSPGTAMSSRLSAILDLSQDLEQGRAPALGQHPFHHAGDDGTFAAAIPDDPIVTPPVYGRWHGEVTRIADVTDAARHWLRELNLDPRARMAAGLGTEVIQTRQEELVRRAWGQAGELGLINGRLREAELSLAIGERLFSKHVEDTDDDRKLQLTATLQRRVRAGGSSIAAQIEATRVPLASRTGAFKRITRPQHKLRAVAQPQQFKQGLVAAFGNQLSAAQPMLEPKAALELSLVSSAVDQAVASFQSEGVRPRYVFMVVILSELRHRVASQPSPNLQTLTLGPAFVNSLKVRLTGGSLDEDIQDRHVAAVTGLIDAIQSTTATSPSSMTVTITDEAFALEFGVGIAGKVYRGLTVAPATVPPDIEVARTTGQSEVAGYQDALTIFRDDVTGTRSDPPPLPTLTVGQVHGFAGTVLQSIRPRAALVKRVLNLIPAVPERPATEPRQLRPVMAHPKFADATFEDLRVLSQDYVIPNYSDLPVNTITLLEPNWRFIEAFLAGLNHEMARELMWREFPTDMRGTFFSVFWDKRDDIAGVMDRDIDDLHTWNGKLGEQGPRGGEGGFLFLVIRGDLFRRYPTTAVYAQRAKLVAGKRRLDDAGPISHPVFRGRLEPDINIFGFALEEAEVRGDKDVDGRGWFFVLQERPGEVNFGLDSVPEDAEDDPGPIPSKWRDLHWGHLNEVGGQPAPVIRIADNNQLATVSDVGQWGASSADMAAILLQDPVIYARHASDMLPPKGS